MLFNLHKKPISHFYCIVSTVLVSLVFVVNAYTQSNRTDSLRNELKSLPQNTEKINVLELLQKDFISVNQYDSALIRSMEMVELTKKLRDFAGHGRAKAHVAYCHYFLGDYSLALYWIRKARISGEKWLDPHFVSVCYGNAGLVLQEMGEYDSAMVYLHKCLKIREAEKDTIHWAYTHYDIAELHIELGEYDRAVEHHEKALDLRKAIPDVVDDYNVIEDSYRALAMAYHRDGDNNRAKELLLESLVISSRKQDIKRLAHTQRELGVVSKSQKDYAGALKCFFESEKLDQSINNLENAAELASLIGATYRDMGKLSEAEEWSIKALAFADRMKLGPKQVESHELLAEIYSDKKRFDLAFLELKKAQSKKDSILNEQKIKALKEMDVRYQTTRKEARIQELNSQNELAKTEAKLLAAEANRTRWILFGVVIILVLVVGLVFVVMHSRRQSVKANKELQTQKVSIEEKNELISQSLSEKEALLKEIHHRVKNNLQIISSLLNLQSASLQDSQALEAIKEGQNRVKSIALIHQKLYQTEDLSKVDFQEYCEQLISFLQSAFQQKGKSIETEIQANNIQLDIDTAVPLGLIINELVTNAYKYAFANQDIGLIQINLNQEEEGLKLTIVDNGIGMPAEFDLKKAKSLGMKLVSILSRQLKGHVTWHNDNGARFVINFQESAARKITA